MTKHPTSLSVHKNSIERRNRKSMQSRMIAAAKGMDEQDVRAYAIVAITSNGDALCSWDSGSVVPLWAFSPIVEQVLSRDIDESGVEDTWSPSLSERTKPQRD